MDMFWVIWRVLWSFRAHYCHSFDKTIEKVLNLALQIKTFEKNVMAPFYGWGSTVSRLQNPYKEFVDFLQLSSMGFLTIIWLTSEEWKAEPTLEPPIGFESRNLWIGNPAWNVPYTEVLGRFTIKDHQNY